MSFAWGALLVAAIAWPGRFVSALDGAPFDRPAAAIGFGLLLPALWCFHPHFLRTPVARGIVLALLAWKLLTWTLVPQAGWCGVFLTKSDPQIGGPRFASSWDARTFWQRPIPACSTIVQRPYERQTEFPAWIVNIPFGHDVDIRRGVPDETALENTRPPDGRYTLLVTGTMYSGDPGTLAIGIGDQTELTGTIDGTPVSGRNGTTATVALPAGTHDVNLTLDLTGRGWQFVPLWNGRDVFSTVRTSIAPLSALDRIVHSLGRWVTPLIVVALLLLWIRSGVRVFQPSPAMLCGVALTAIAAAWLAFAGETSLGRFAAVPLAASLFLPMPRRLRNGYGAWLIVGAPWLASIAARGFPQIGAFSMFHFGDDMLTYQRFAYRIFKDGYWLEGGQKTFWNQPLYRWISGGLHVFYGDSSVGELFADGVALLICAMFAYHVARRMAGFRVGIAAAVGVLLTITVGPNWYIVGRGLSEIAAAGFVYAAALILLRARHSNPLAAATAAAVALLAFFTRLNHLLLVVALMALLLPVTARSVRAGLAYTGVLVTGLVAFSARTWYYTGTFSLFAGTTRVHNATGLGLTPGSIWSADAWRSAFESVLMIVTVADPPRADPRAVLVVVGVALAVLRVLCIPGVRARVPLAPAIVCVSAIVSGLFVRGLAYPGRFSIHVIPVAVALSVGAGGALVAQIQAQRRPADARVSTTGLVH